MIHEIQPKNYTVGFFNCEPREHDSIIAFDGDLVCYRLEGDVAKLPAFGELSDKGSQTFIYLFSIDDERFFLAEQGDKNSFTPPKGYEMREYGLFREIGPRYIAFAIVTARHLSGWYADRKFCGKCGTGMALSETERACFCPKCGLIEYPKISPCVIVAVTDGEHLLLTRYKNHPYRRYALIAGFVEIGESLEDCVRREVFEETGVNVKNIRYYKSQPWAFTGTLLAGFFCELDGDGAISLDENELSEASWLKRKDIPPAISDIALTAEMMEMFRLGNI
ncbi:MAG: NAD(+) diphosphatase [Oscillospiraceae bacterium]|nr:NAD(+) diphosphatase [Oscillospiraceae bacterium]